MKATFEAVTHNISKITCITSYRASCEYEGTYCNMKGVGYVEVVDNKDFCLSYCGKTGVKWQCMSRDCITSNGKVGFLAKYNDETGEFNFSLPGIMVYGLSGTIIFSKDGLD